MTSGMSIAVRPSAARNSSTTSSISSSTAEATAVADSEIVRIAGDQRADEHAATGVRDPVALHARPPSTAPPVNRSGTLRAKSTSARR